MIRDEVIFWGAAILLVFFAFVLMPAHERFKDAQGRETDVSPDAPPKPEGLKPINERTGQREGFWSSITSFFSPSREKMTNSTLTMDDVNKAKLAFLHKLALNETDPTLKTYLGSFVDGGGPIDNTPVNNIVFFSSYKLYTSSYTSLQEIAAAAHTNKPTDPSHVMSFLTNAGLTIFGNTSQAPPLSGVTAQQSGTPPQFNTDSTLGATTGTTGMEKTLTQGDLQEAQVRFIQTLIGNEPDQATKQGLANGAAVLQQLARSAPTSVTNIPIGSFERAVYNSLTGAPSSYTYKQFAMAYQSAGGVNASSQNIVQMVQSIPDGINMTAPPPQVVTNVSQMSEMSALTPPDLYGPGPNVLRSALKSCSCASQTSGCPIHA